MTGVIFPQFVSGGNKAPEKPLIGSMAYNAIKGKMTIHRKFYLIDFFPRIIHV
jgi:hypothetical protein